MSCESRGRYSSARADPANPGRGDGRHRDEVAIDCAVYTQSIGVEKSSSSVFDVDRVEDGEALIVAEDRHLDFAASVRIDAAHRLLSVTTSVRLHGWRGRLYFIPVSILHGPVLRAMAKRAVGRAAT